MVENENQTTKDVNALNPGGVISPGGLVQPSSAPAVQAQPSQEAALVAVDEAPQTFAFRENDSSGEFPQQTSNGEDVEWSASEFVHHEKNTKWYLTTALATAVAAIAVYFATRDLVTVSIIIFCAIMFSVYANRKPRQLPYGVSDEGVRIGQKTFGYGEFRAFSIVQEGPFSSIVLSPLKRFAPLTTLYYPPEQEDKIISIIANYLPVETRKQDAIDKLMHQIGF